MPGHRDPQGDPITLPTTADVRNTESSSTEAQGIYNTTPSSFRCPPKEEIPPAEPTTSTAEVDIKDTLPGTAEAPPGGDTMILSTKSDAETPKDPLTSQATSPTEVETQVVCTTRLLVKLAGLLTPSNQAEEERWCVLIVTASMGRLNLEATGVTPRDTVTASVGRVAFKNPQMAVAFPGPTKGRKVVGHQDATMEELVEKDLAGDHP